MKNLKNFSTFTDIDPDAAKRLLLPGAQIQVSNRTFAQAVADKQRYCSLRVKGVNAVKRTKSRLFIDADDESGSCVGFVRRGRRSR